MTVLTPQILLGAYASGIFPMAESRHDSDLYWIDPDVRGVIPLIDFHIPRRLRRTLRNGPYEIRSDSDFVGVIRGCAEPTRMRPDTWINTEIEGLYNALFDMGFAHSVETWQDGELVGGLYGVSLGGAFFGESMFSRASDASKVALCHLAARLRKSGYTLLDSQFLTEHLRQFGAIEINRPEYKARLAAAIKVTAVFQSELSGDELEAFIQSTTQTS
ncbi:MAG: leucyl/phenylalanyl-tRNA--protein transferase [Alphaproteobacteria bacterium]|nr:leucyl/phenylalanyl-tRNA--protein transferase [Alphaproteobacteria bacterium]MCZ6509701.1 leucyl/phenylalanyl-tRNA--protein transferase [Alphaproteobacteria bacterium]MCZ6587122.1 leucyl/phenylalanyl-tRNA--protein transferase [Alphaproteobacteria bacterium]MCZ6590883.1 leucyl/phenylalanyl-tRNA--protein transferase [Alphaproteobacteria bacterium]MCZ6838502.1 leucyl/phenylalanyl-tRNA--protein transferase [Alphaproteobacteria bacterium]